jgi:Phospholipid-translocating P-type ATPase C-terminal
MSMASFSAIIYIVNLKVGLVSRTINVINCVSILGSMLLYYIWLWLGNYLVLSFVSSILPAHRSPLFYLSVFQTVFLAFCVDYFVESLFFILKPNPSQYLRDLAANKVDFESKEQLRDFRAFCEPIRQQQR